MTDKGRDVAGGDTTGDSSTTTALAELEFLLVYDSFLLLKKCFVFFWTNNIMKSFHFSCHCSDYVLGDVREKFRLDNSRDPRREEMEKLLCSLFW